MSTLTPSVAAKAYAALIAGILLAGLTAWQQAEADGLDIGNAIVVVLIAVLPGIIAWLVPAPGYQGSAAPATTDVPHA